jgi:hypothetical protein
MALLHAGLRCETRGLLAMEDGTQGLALLGTVLVGQPWPPSFPHREGSSAVGSDQDGAALPGTNRGPLRGRPGV